MERSLRCRRYKDFRLFLLVCSNASDLRRNRLNNYGPNF